MRKLVEIDHDTAMCFWALSTAIEDAEQSVKNGLPQQGVRDLGRASNILDNLASRFSSIPEKSKDNRRRW